MLPKCASWTRNNRAGLKNVLHSYTIWWTADFHLLPFSRVQICLENAWRRTITANLFFKSWIKHSAIWTFTEMVSYEKFSTEQGVLGYSACAMRSSYVNTFIYSTLLVCDNYALHSGALRKQLNSGLVPCHCFFAREHRQAGSVVYVEHGCAYRTFILGRPFQSRRHGKAIDYPSDILCMTTALQSEQGRTVGHFRRQFIMPTVGSCNRDNRNSLGSKDVTHNGYCIPFSRRRNAC